MKKILFVLVTIFGTATVSFAQQKVLFNFGPNKAYLDEFERQFYKNNPAESITRDTAKYYMGLFVNFKLKVQQAKDLGLDTARDFVNEMAQYRKQLAQPYMVDTSYTQMLIDEAYNNMGSEVKASHIMVAIGYDALPKDTLIAWNKAMDIKKKLKNEPFDSVAYKYSDDKSALTNFGHLGYFTAFSMIYPFEKATYNTKVGEVTGPVRTQYGYHLIKLWDRRPARGKTRIAHILLRLDEKAGDDEILRQRQRMDSIVATINSGKATFEEMVAQYSEDFSTKERNGEIGWLENTDRNFPENFRDVVYGLKNDGDISQPIKSSIGWHLVKRLERQNIQPKDSIYNELKRKVTNPRDERFALSREAVINRIKKEYTFTENQVALQGFIQKADSSIVKGLWNADEKQVAEATLFTLRNENFTTSQFSKFIELNQQPLVNNNIEMAVKNLYKSFCDQTVWEYEENHLAEKQDKYKYLVEEYNDGILLFNLSEKRVWNKGHTDTVGLKAYYEENKNRFMWEERLEATIYECKDKDLGKQVKKWIKKDLADTTISRMAFDQHPLSLAIKYGKFQKADHPAIGKIKWKKGTYEVEAADKYYVVVVKQKLPVQNKTLSEIRGPITSEYQAILEKQWIDELKAQYPVTINQQLFDEFLSTLPR